MTTIGSVPTLSPGLTLLETDPPGTVPAIAINQALLFGGDAAWIDSGGRARTDVITQLTPSDDVLDRMTITRAFTAHQHHTLVQQLPDRLDRQTAVAVVPGIDHFYAADDDPAGQDEELFHTTLDRLRREADRYNIPVLVTTDSDRYHDTVQAATDHVLECRQTSEGIRFATEQYDQLAYRGPDYIQTTLLFWEQVLEETYARVQTEVLTRGTY